VLHSFVFEGNYPVSEVIQGTDGNLYGTTSTGGSLGGGIVFKIDISGTEPVFTVLHPFDVVDITSEVKSNNPLSSVVQGCDNKLYGTTSNDGKNKAGTIYQIDISGPTPIFNVLHEFDGSNGDSANASLIKGKNCKFYGTTNPADNTKKAIAFLLDTSTAMPCYRTLYEFNKPDGSPPPAGLLEGNDGKFYGITSEGGQKGYGTVYQLDFSASVAAYKTLHHFDAPITNVSQPPPQTDPVTDPVQSKAVSPVPLALASPAPSNPPENVAPIANNDSFVLMSAKKIVRIAHTAPGVLINDSDAENMPLTVVGATVATPKIIDLPREGGKVALYGDGHFDYIPRKKCFTGTRNFGYQVTDGQSTSNAATVTLTIKKNRSCR
jgi:uncharacterized repeat protein (TIGR03803 family)